MLNGILDFIKSKLFLWNLVTATVFIFIALFVTQHWLENYTRHGESISVPDLRNLSIARVESFLEDKKLRYSVIDSIYKLDKPPGVVLEQDPLPNVKVKENRVIYLSINATLPPIVKMPNLIDVSLRQAEAILNANGLKLGKLIYKPDLAKNAVLAQLYRGSEINSGNEIAKGSLIDLVLGDGLGNTMVPVPMLTGLTKTEALFVLKGSSLTIGSVNYDEDVRNQENAKVYRQFPEFNETSQIAQGQAVDIYLR